ncbi:methyltransferase domain-containing protein [Roseicyclus marinus]
MMTGSRVAEYYDANTRRFLAVGGSGSALAIHRPLWADGVSTPSQAAAHVNDIIRMQAERHLGRAPRRVLDLGCGVGGSLFHLAPFWPEAKMTGITISAVQRAKAEAEATRRNLSARCRFLRADFTEVRGSDADLAMAIESHVHAQSAAAFLDAAASALGTGGVLVIVDDMLRRPETDLTMAERRWLDRFRAGWRLGHVPDLDGLQAAADCAGFDRLDLQDLTPLIRLDRLRDRALHLAGPVAHRVGLNHWPIFANMIGGDALTRLYKMGTMGYTCVTLRKRG